MSLNPKKPPKGIANAELLVVRTQELDSYGESMNLYQARKHMSGILGEFVTAINRLSRLGFTTFIFVADHGHVLLPEIRQETQSPSLLVSGHSSSGVSLLGHSTGSASGVMVLKTDHLGMHAPVPEMAVATGFRVFKSGSGYFHEGIRCRNACCQSWWRTFRPHQTAALRARKYRCTTALTDSPAVSSA